MIMLMFKKIQPLRQQFFSLFLILTLLVCGVGSLFCPMSSSAADDKNPQTPFHHTPSLPEGSCPDQITSSSEGSKEFSSAFLINTDFIKALAAFLHAPSQKLVFVHTPPGSSYPLLFLLFSVLLN
jgi:hypothetical protein